jgi:hypothetical protein
VKSHVVVSVGPSRGVGAWVRAAFALYMCLISCTVTGGLWRDPPPDTSVWLLFLFGAAAAAMTGHLGVRIFELVSREIVYLSRTRLKLVLRVGPWRRVLVFSRASLAELRVEEHIVRGKHGRSKRWRLEFQYEGLKRHASRYLNEREADRVQAKLDAMRGTVPQ